MALTLVADFDSRAKAKLATDNLSLVGIPREHVDTYPSVIAAEPHMPSANEKVSGAETRLSNDGPLGHLQTLLAKLFHIGVPDERGANGSPSIGSEPTHDAASTEYIFVAVDVSGDPSLAKAARSVLEKAGASRIELHEVDA